jgi:drug/metabolite transporter (DMT)-like permease
MFSDAGVEMDMSTGKVNGQAAKAMSAGFMEGGGASPHAALFLVQLIFGSWPIAAKVALRALPSTGLVAFRISGAAIAFLLLQSAVGRVPITDKLDYARILIYSLLGVVFNQLLFVKGLSMTTVIDATLLGTTIPIFALLISIALGYDRFSLRRAMGILLAALGVVYLVNPARASFSGDATLGNLLIVLNSICYGAYIAISKDVIKRYGALTVITWVFVFGGLLTAPIGALNTSRESIMSAGVSVWLAVLYIILVPTVGAYYLNAWALARVAPSTVAVYIYLQPLIAFMLAPWILHESWNSRTWVAAALIFAGVAIVTWRARSVAIEEVSEHPDALGH